MATPSPRKFQEKIALLQQKEAEGKIAYDNIMNEVQGLRMHPKSSGQPKGPQLLPPQAQSPPFQQPPPQHPSRPPQSGSLPDFSINLPAVLACDPPCWPRVCGSPELRGVALRPPDALRTHQDQGRVPEYYVQGQGTLQGAVQDLNILQNQVYSGIPHHRVSVPSQIRPHPHIPPHLGNSPAYPVLLSPPPPSESLLRSNSDSSLHQNLLHGGKVANNRKVSAPVEVGRMDTGLGMNLYGPMRHNQELQNRPKSGCELTHPSEIIDVLGTRINHVQRSPNIPIPTTITNTGGAGPGGGGGVGALPNTGSLPDLTQVQYLQPMNTPIPDTDLTTISSGSARLGTTFPTGVLGDPYSSGQASPRGTSPGPSPSVMRKKPQKPYQPTQTNHRGAHHGQNKNHLSVPTVINARYLHTCKGMTVDNSTIVDPHMANSGLNLFGQPLSPSGSHPPSPNQLSFMDYRNPVSPQLSPRSSPGPCHTLQTGGLGSYSSNSPSDSRSAPPSPSAPQASPASSPGVTISKPFSYNEYHTHAQTNQLNQQFEQCKMIDNSPVSANSYASSGNSNVHPQAGLLDIGVEGNGFFGGAPSSNSGVPQGCPIPTSQTHQQPTGPPPPYPQSSTSPAHQQLQQTSQQQQEQQQQHQQQQQQHQQQQQQHQQQQQQSQQQQALQSQQQQQQQSQQQPQHHQQPSPTHPQHITQSPNHHPHHPPSPAQSISPHAPPSPAQDPLSPASHNHTSMQHPPTPQTPQTPTFITPQVVVTIPPGEGTEDSLLQENIGAWDMFASSPYEEGSFESSILDHMSRLDENELSMMVDQGAVDQLLVDQETEEGFRRDHRTTSSTTTSGP